MHRKNPRPASRCVGFESVGRGYAKNYREFNRRSAAFSVTLAEVYSFREDWHQGACASLLIRQYQVALDAAIEHRPELQGCAVACRHCGIRFLTHPRNARRKDLRCPFGCRKHHSRQSANERSRLHSQSDSAKRKKKRLNGKRSQHGCEVLVAPVCDVDEHRLAAAVGQAAIADVANGTSDDVGREMGIELSHVGCREAADEPVPADGSWESPSGMEVATVVELPLELSLESCVLDEDTLVTSSVLPYLRMVASLILRRTISCEELLTRLRRHMRQHSIGRHYRGGYVLPYVNKHPP